MSEHPLEKREEEEQDRGRSLGKFHGLDCPALDRLLVHATKDRPKELYGLDVLVLAGGIQTAERGVRETEKATRGYKSDSYNDVS